MTPEMSPSNSGDETNPTKAPVRPVSLTGIKPTGDLHIGNYVGAIRPALKLTEDYESLYFIADYHALTSVRDASLLRSYTRSAAATWLACGLDPSKTLLYRQSDIPEIFELNWVLSCVTGKGLMNRAHAYKAMRDRNKEAGTEDLDAGINMGVFNYPVLMTADIISMEADVVPVGRDQTQHVEYAADIAGSFNHMFGGDRQGGYSFPIPQHLVAKDDTAVLPGLDGRKMSKSYTNTIPLFCSENELRKLVRKVKSDSTPVEAPKDPDSSHAYILYANFAAESDVQEVRRRLQAGGMGWGELKDLLFDAINNVVSPLRKRYEELMDPQSELDTILADGAVRARHRARRVLSSVRVAIGVE